MQTKWNMTFFLFLGMISAALLLCSLFCSLREERRTLCRVSALTAFLGSLSAVLVIAFGLNNPAKLVNILGRPLIGLSSAIISQILVAFAALVMFVRNNTRKSIGYTVIVCVFSLIAVFSLSRLYMINTRPALNSFLLVILFTLITLQLAGSFLRSETWEGHETVTYANSMLLITGLYGISLIGFILRIGWLNPEDRVFQIQKLVAGSLAPVFWGLVIFSLVVPLLFYFWARTSETVLRTHLDKVINLVGVFVLSVLINQMPVVSRGINGRFLS